MVGVVVAPLLGLGSSHFWDRNLKLSLRLPVRAAVVPAVGVSAVDVLVVGLAAAAAAVRVVMLAAVVEAHFAAVAVPGIHVDVMSLRTRRVAAVCCWCWLR